MKHSLQGVLSGVAYSLVQGNTQFSFQSMVSEGSMSLDEQCIDTDSAVIYKYTIASSTPTEVSFT